MDHPKQASFCSSLRHYPLVFGLHQGLICLAGRHGKHKMTVLSIACFVLYVYIYMYMLTILQIKGFYSRFFFHSPSLNLMRLTNSPLQTLKVAVPVPGIHGWSDCRPEGVVMHPQDPPCHPSKSLQNPLTPRPVGNETPDKVSEAEVRAAQKAWSDAIKNISKVGFV